MTTADRRTLLHVGVYDEPELIVLGVHGLLGREDERVRVIPVAPEPPAPALDVILCDPFGRSVTVETYLERVAALSSARLVVYSWAHSPAGVRRALAAGAAAYVSKATSSADLLDALDAVVRGEPVEPLAAETPDPAGPVLSVRESEVLALICRGMSNLEIAAHLYVSVNSVKTYIRQIYQKIEVTRRAQAVAWGMSRGY